MLERQSRSVQGGIKNAPMPTVETSTSKKAGTVILSIDVQGLGPWRGQRPNLTCFIGRWFGVGSHPPQHQSREAGSCMGRKRRSCAGGHLLRVRPRRGAAAAWPRPSLASGRPAVGNERRAFAAGMPIDRKVAQQCLLRKNYDCRSALESSRRRGGDAPSSYSGRYTL
jgi:hypothetical protein